MSLDTLTEHPKHIQQAGNLDPTSTGAITAWYRNLRPETDIQAVPLATHFDAISSYLLLANSQEVPDSQDARNRAGLALSNSGSAELISRVSSEGVGSLVLSDLILELSERDDRIPPVVTAKLLDFGAGVAASVRENPLLKPEEKLAANNRVFNLTIAKLKFDNKHLNGGVPNFSDRYMATVRAEAAWMIKNASTVKTGALFESFIGNFAKHQTWEMGHEEELTVRHATMREDAPNRASEGGGGFKYAHDVHIENDESAGIKPALIQVKWGPGSNELESRYDQKRVTFVSESSDDGLMSNNRQILEALQAIAGKSPEAMQATDALAQRYPKLGNVIRHTAGEQVRTNGNAILVLS